MSKKKKEVTVDLAQKAYNDGYKLLNGRMMFEPLLRSINIVRYHGTHRFDPSSEISQNKQAWGVVNNNGYLRLNPDKKAEPEEWEYVLAHYLLHLGFNHLVKKDHPKEWQVACDCYIAHFLADLKVGRCPENIRDTLHVIPRKSEEKLYAELCDFGIPDELQEIGLNGYDCDMDIFTLEEARQFGLPFLQTRQDYCNLFAKGLTLAVNNAIGYASGYAELGHQDTSKSLRTKSAKEWFINTYPLLGALVASFEIIDDIDLCRRLDIQIGAVNTELGEIYINPVTVSGSEGYRFVIAHEILHVSLSHAARCRWRDPYLWNVACDFVINHWLVEMGFSGMPSQGLYDTELKGLSAENIYDRLVGDLRKARKLMTLRGYGKGDIINDNPNVVLKDGTTLDDFVRRCLSQGLEYHLQNDRGFLPADLIEEIRSLMHPPIFWDVKLALWFQDNFAPVERRRTYSRLNRHQASTPNIPRPSWYIPKELLDKRTFGVILDTSGSMDRTLLAKALGAIASYSAANDVPSARVIFCDAAVYDQGYMSPETIADVVKVRGRGGTVLQPAIDFLEKAEDFPKDGPILVITDGWCDQLHLHREHAFLVPEHARLPFLPRGPVFKIK